MMKKICEKIGLIVIGIVGGVIGEKRAGKLRLDTEKQYSIKHLSLFLMMNQWVKVKQDGKNLKDYFMAKGYKRIAIYGMSYVGERLVEELKKSEIEIVYGIDRNAHNIYSDIDVVTVENQMEEVDAIVITAITFLNEIEEKLSKKVHCPLISLEDILYEV